MITEARPMPGKTWSECIFVNGSMSNDEYHSKPGISSSGLKTVIKDSLGAYKYADPSELPQKILDFGTASHAALLEPKTFDENFYRDACPKDDGMLGTERGCDSAVKSRLKELGASKYTSLKGDELFEFALKADPDMKILDVERKRLAKKHKGKTAVVGADYDKLMKMRKVMLAHPQFSEIINSENMFFETSIFCQVKVDGCDDWIDVKLRPDVVTKNFLVPDYKTTGVDLNPDEIFGFDNQAIKMCYHMRLWFTCDVLSAIYQKQFKPSLLAQSTKTPYIPTNIDLSPAPIQWHARKLYTDALKKYSEASKSNKWPVPYSKTREINIPYWLQREYDEFMETQE